MRSKFKTVFKVIFITFLVIGMTSALSTKINVKADKDRKVTIRFQDPEGTLGTLAGGTFLDILTDDRGIASATFSSDIYNKVDLSVTVRNLQGNLIRFQPGDLPSKLFNDLKTGWVYDIDTTLSNPIPIQVGKYVDIYGSTTSNTSLSLTNITNTTQTSSTSTESSETNGNKDSSDVEPQTEETTNEEETSESFFNWKKIAIYTGIIIIIIILISLLVFFSIFIIKKLKKQDFSSKIYFGKPLNSSKLTPHEKKILDDAQKKINIAQDEINKIKDKDSKIRELEERIRKDRAELEKLRKHKI